MRFMMMIKGDKNHEAGIPPKPELIAAIGKLTEEMYRSGVMVGAGGFFPSAMGARLRASEGKITVTDGRIRNPPDVRGTGMRTRGAEFVSAEVDLRSSRTTNSCFNISKGI